MSTKKLRYLQFLKIFRTIVETLQLREIGRDTSRIWMMKEALQPISTSTDTFMTIVLTMYQYNGHGYIEEILHLADIHHDNDFKDSSSISYDNILLLCNEILKQMNKEIEIVEEPVYREPMLLLKDFMSCIRELRILGSSYN